MNAGFRPLSGLYYSKFFANVADNFQYSVSVPYRGFIILNDIEDVDYNKELIVSVPYRGFIILNAVSTKVRLRMQSCFRPLSGLYYSK